MLSVLKDRGIDASWYRMILTVACNPAGGWNLRNDVGHGFIDDTTAASSAVLIQAILHLATLVPKSSSGGDVTATEEAENPDEGEDPDGSDADA